MCFDDYDSSYDSCIYYFILMMTVRVMKEMKSLTLTGHEEKKQTTYDFDCDDDNEDDSYDDADGDDEDEGEDDDDDDHYDDDHYDDEHDDDDG